MSKRAAILVSLTVGALAALGATAQPSVAAGNPCVVTDSDSRQVWFGDAGDDVTFVALQLQELVDAHPDQATGVAYCSHYEGAAIYLTDSNSPVADAARKVAEVNPSVTVEVHEVAAPLSELTQLSADVTSEASLTQYVEGAGPNIHDGSVEVRIELAASRRTRLARESAVRRFVGQRSYGRIQVKLEAAGIGQPASRRADSSPWYMGGELNWRIDSRHTGLCSSGVPISVGSVHGLLTAGHCRPGDGKFYNNGTEVGKDYATSYPAHADTWGDWKLIQGSTYSKEMFNGGPDGSTHATINDVRWGTVPLGTAICTSGRTTGLICNYKVVHVNWRHIIGGVHTGQLMELTHDSNGGSGADQNGFQGGDSGGTCFYSTRRTGIVATGIVTGTFDATGEDYHYECTQLSGVRAWNSSATFG